MDPQVLVAAQSASSTMIALLVTDVWERARDGMVDVWRRFRPSQAPSVSASLDDTRTRLLQARQRGDENTELDLSVHWTGSLARLLAADPQAAAEVERALTQARALLSDHEAATVPMVHLHATATGQGRVYQAGRDQHITER